MIFVVIVIVVAESCGKEYSRVEIERWNDGIIEEIREHAEFIEESLPRYNAYVATIQPPTPTILCPRKSIT